MGFIQQPSLRIVDRGGEKPSNIVSAGYDFSTDTAVPITFIPGRPMIHGTFFTVDLTSLGHPRALPAVRSLQFTATFGVTDAVGFVDGGLILYVPSTGELIEFAVPALISNLTSSPADFSIPVMTGVIPLVCTSPTTIQIVKGSGNAEPPPTGAQLRGNIIVNLYDFDRAPYLATGFYSNYLAG